MIIMIDDASEVEGSIFAFKCKGTRPIFRSFRFIFGRKCDINLIVLHTFDDDSISTRGRVKIYSNTIPCITFLQINI